jgi:hypothetical protein
MMVEHADYKILKDETNRKFLAAPLKIALCSGDKNPKFAGECNSLISVFICPSCDDTHLQLQFGPDENKTLLSVLLHPDAAMFLANELNCPDALGEETKSIIERD